MRTQDYNAAKIEPHDAHARALRAGRTIVLSTYKHLSEDAEKGVYSVKQGDSETFHVYRRGRFIGTVNVSEGSFSHIRGYENLHESARTAVKRFLSKKHGS